MSLRETPCLSPARGVVKAWARACALMVPFLLVSPSAGHAGATAGRVPAWRIERDVLRFRFVATNPVMDLLAVRPGMTVLDLGTGTGQFAFEFSRRLNGTGRVFATDTRADCVDYVKEEAERRGLRNLRSVLVGKQGLDAFYGRQRYDLIAVFHVAMDYENRVDYLRKLRDCLAEGGRLVLVLQKIPGPFSPGDFNADFPELIKALSRASASDPLSRCLKDSTRKMIRDGGQGERPEALKHAIADDLNLALRSDGRFAESFMSGSAFGAEVRLTPDERLVADFLLVAFRNRQSVRRNLVKADGAAPPAAGGNNPKDAEAMLLNKLLIVQALRPYLNSDRLFLPGFTPPIRSAFERAGYRLRAEHSGVIPLEDLVIFSAR